MEFIGGDIRSAGDAINYLPDWCLRPHHDPESEWSCPAILDAHPWRITLARNAWQPGPDGIHGTTDDTPNNLVGFQSNRENVVTYEYRPAGARQSGPGGHQFYRGRLVRIEDPFGFGGAGSRRETVLADDVVVDNRMVVDPENPSANDERFDFAVFTYRLLSTRPGEFQGDEAIVARSTRRGAFLLPPVSFFVAGSDLPVPPTVSPYRPTYANPGFTGSKRQGTGRAPGLLQGSTPAEFEKDLAFILAHNRIRAVRVAFKTVTGDERAGYTDGVDLDPARPGTAPTVLLESTFDVKVFSGHFPRNPS